MIASVYDKRYSVLLYRDKSEIYKRNGKVASHSNKHHSIKLDNGE